jgi:hypothetical protein
MNKMFWSGVLMLGLCLSACSNEQNAQASSVQAGLENSQATSANANANAHAVTGDEKQLRQQRSAFLAPIKRDIAAQMDVGLSEFCNLGLELTENSASGKSGDPIRFNPDGIVKSGKHVFDFVKEEGASLNLTHSRLRDEYTFGAEIYAPDSGERLGVIGLTKTAGQELVNANFSVDKKETHYINSCVDKQKPAIYKTELWNLAAKYMLFKTTSLQCMELGKFDAKPVVFKFGGNSIDVGTFRFLREDGRFGETLQLDLSDKRSILTYTLSKNENASLTIGVNHLKQLTFANYSLADGVIYQCGL